MKLHEKEAYTYATFRSMRYRCSNKNSTNFKHYGGRGITVSKEWTSFKKFLTDMGQRPKGHTLDRIDNKKGYSKLNCKWTNSATQARNRSSTIIYNGECALDASLRLGGAKTLVQKRLGRGWSKKEAFTKPLIKRGDKR